MNHGQLRCIVIKHNTCEHKNEDVTIENKVISSSDEAHHINFKLPYKQAANAFMSVEGYSKYVEKHGYHFTDRLAEHVSELMENANGQQHTWTTNQVKKALENIGFIIPDKITLGDITYLANMYYADLYPEPFKEEISCLKAACKIANDPDGYEGMIFCRWTADAVGKAIFIDWEKFI